MKYVGSKNRLAKELAPIIQSYITEDINGYLEPFVGGANMIDKIKCKKKIGLDIHRELISLLKYVQNPDNKLPEGISKDEYIRVRDNKEGYPDWYVGLIGFCGSYNAKWFGGYAGECRTKGGIRHYDREAIRNIEKQREGLRDIYFGNVSFLEIPKWKLSNYLIYCDIPYRETTEYKDSGFPYDDFYEWCLEVSKLNTVLVSEYWMPDSGYCDGKYKGVFNCIWSKEHKTSLDKNNNNKKRTEKLFVVKNTESEDK